MANLLDVHISKELFYFLDKNEEKLFGQQILVHPYDMSDVLVNIRLTMVQLEIVYSNWNELDIHLTKSTILDCINQGAKLSMIEQMIAIYSTLGIIDILFVVVSLKPLKLDVANLLVSKIGDIDLICTHILFKCIQKIFLQANVDMYLDLTINLMRKLKIDIPVLAAGNQASRDKYISFGRIQLQNMCRNDGVRTIKYFLSIMPDDKLTKNITVDMLIYSISRTKLDVADQILGYLTSKEQLPLIVKQISPLLVITRCFDNNSVDYLVTLIQNKTIEFTLDASTKFARGIMSSDKEYAFNKLVETDIINESVVKMACDDSWLRLNIRLSEERIHELKSKYTELIKKS